MYDVEGNKNECIVEIYIFSEQSARKWSIKRDREKMYWEQRKKKKNIITGTAYGAVKGGYDEKVPVIGHYL
jgi:hypothetical protein